MEKYLSLSDLNHWVERCSKFLSAFTGIEYFVQPKDIFISFENTKFSLKLSWTLELMTDHPRNSKLKDLQINS